MEITKCLILLYIIGESKWQSNILEAQQTTVASGESRIWPQMGRNVVGGMGGGLNQCIQHHTGSISSIYNICF